VKNKKTLIIAIVVVVLVLIGVTLYVLSSRNSAPAVQNNEPGTAIQTAPKIDPKEIGLTLKMGDDGKRVVMAIADTSNLSGIDYELSYTSTGGIPRGAIGHIDIKTKGKAISQEIVLGTCSDVCHYDQDVTDIKLVVKVTKSDGKIYEADLSL
jgi:hypothetical protein